jgi:hypothetical protein
MEQRQRKWIVLSAVGTLSGLATLLIFRSIPLAAGSATALVVMVIAIKHLALAAILGSPAFGVFQSIKPKLREYCPWPPQ